MHKVIPRPPICPGRKKEFLKAVLLLRVSLDLQMRYCSSEIYVNTYSLFIKFVGHNLKTSKHCHFSLTLFKITFHTQCVSARVHNKFYEPSSNFFLFIAIKPKIKARISGRRHVFHILQIVTLTKYVAFTNVLIHYIISKSLIKNRYCRSHLQVRAFVTLL
jgi:hypothetical protein